MPPIDRHTLWYRESVVCLDTIVWFVGADVDIHIAGKLNLLIGVPEEKYAEAIQAIYATIE